MNKEWDLTPLYEGIDTEKFQNDMKALAEKSGAFNAFAAKLPETERSAVLHRALELQEEIMGLALPLFEYAGLRSSVNTADQEAVNAQAKLQKLMSDTSAAQAALQAYVGRTENLEELIAADPFLGDYAYLLRTMRDDAKYVLDEKVEEALAKMNLSGGSAWSNLQSYLTSTVTADYRGEKIPLSAVRNLAYDADPQVRKDAYDAEVACYDKIKDGVCFALNSIKQQVTTEAEMRKAGSPLEMTLRHSRMQKTTLDAMIQAIEEYLPVFWKYLRAKAKMLGYEGGLKWWDLFAPMGKNTATYTVEEAKQYLNDHFRPFAPDMADMMMRAFDEAWIDFYPHPGKVGGAFCANLASVKQSRVLTNFDGSFSDIVTLAHELGHAYHGMMIENHRPLNLDYSTFGAITGVVVSQVFILSQLNTMSASERASLSEADLSVIQAGELNAVTTAYVVLGIVMAVLLLAIALTRMPAIKEEAALDIKGSSRRLVRNRNYVWGVVAQFFYVGAQIAVWSYVIRYAMHTLDFDGVIASLGPEATSSQIIDALRGIEPLGAGFYSVCSALGIDALLPRTAEQAGATYYILSLVLFVLMRFVCTFLMKYIRPRKLLAAISLLAVACTLGVIYGHGAFGIYCLIAISGCMSLMFPTIYGLGTRNLGEDMKLGGAGMIMAIAGAAVLTQIEGIVSDQSGSIATAYWIPAIAFMVILFYSAYICRKYEQKQTA